MDDDLSPEELRELAEAEPDPVKRADIERKSLEISNALVLKWQKYAYKLARQYHGKFPRDKHGDINGEALLGLVEASKKYDRRRGPFPVVVELYVRNNILRFKYKEGGLVADPRSVVVNPDRITDVVNENGWWLDRDRFDRACDVLDVEPEHRESLRAAWELRSRQYMPMLEDHEPFSGDSEQVVQQFINKDEFDYHLSLVNMLPWVVREIIMDYLEGIKQEETCKRLNVSGPTLLRYRQLGFRWCRYYLGLGPSPDRRDVPKKGLEGEPGTAVPGECWEDCWEEQEDTIA